MIRVHESHVGVEESETAFNLDDWDQFERYIRAVAANRGHFLYSQFTKMLPNKNIFATIHADNGNTRIHITGSLEQYCADCVYCRMHFDPTAGNGTQQGGWLVGQNGRSSVRF